MTESNEEKLSRVEQMILDEGDTWDLSLNDKEAIRYVLERLLLLEDVACWCGLIQSEDWPAARFVLKKAGWHRLDNEHLGWHHPAMWPYPENRTIGTESACMMELDHALNKLK